ncbi:MAG TPA: tRNA pseudouridine(55) synthase TruB [Methylovirgula sp.]|nr:tRNA pseudouridine(55) synthase TruB [Methylovirgula sp.]
MNAPRSTRVEVNGWVALDKPVGMTSTHAVARLKRMFNAKKAGHAGTLDPLASGILPVAFGEATKTVSFVQDGEKTYRFTIAWGAETDSDDADGTIVATSDHFPELEQISAALPAFTGRILQRPPVFSAIKVAGERAYDLARDGEMPVLAPRPVEIHSLELISFARESATFEARCGKGFYVRALARDLGRQLGCYGHIAALRRTRVGPFDEEGSVTLDELADAPAQALLRVEAGLMEMPQVLVDRNAAARLRRGQSILLRGRDAPETGPAYASCGGVVVAVGAVEHGELVPGRVFNLPF